MEHVYNGHTSREVTEMLAQLSKPNTGDARGNVLKNFNALPTNVYYIAERDLMLQRADPSVWTGSLRTSHRGDAKAFEFVSLVAKKFPRLTFCLRMGAAEVDAEGVSHAWFRWLYVHDDGEPVGAMNIETKWGNSDVVMHFRNNRIHKARKHGGDMKTTKIDRGKSIIAKYFYGLTALENIRHKADVVIHQAHSNSLDVHGNIRRAHQQVTNFVDKQLEANPTFLEYMERLCHKQCEQGGPGTSAVQLHANPVELYKSLLEDTVQINAACAAQKQGDGLFLTMDEEREEYHTWKKGAATVKKYTRQQLPDKVRGALGMLKIAENASFIGGTGYKYERGYYWITQEIANEFGD